MKKLIKLLALFILSFSLSANPISFIEGKWENITNSTVRLFKIENSKLKEIACSVIDQENNFYFAFNSRQEGLYVIGANSASNTKRDSYLFYFKPGDNLSVTINSGSYLLTGENTPENRELEKWQTIINPLLAEAVYRKNSSWSYKEFFPLLEDVLEKAGGYQPAFTGNERFDKIYRDYRTLTLLEPALLFLYSPRTAHPQIADYPEYYRKVDLKKIDSELFLDYPDGLNLLNLYVRTQAQLNGELFNSQAELLDNGFIHGAFEWLTDKKVQGEIILSFAQFQKTFPGRTEYGEKYRKYLFTEDQKKRMNDLILAVYNPEEGEDAIDFRFPDIHSKEIALSDLKGKIVYIDVWATWCAPCKKEIPYLKKLEHEYEGKDIVFLSVSTDSSKDYEKWKEFIKEEALGGVQLFGGDKAKEALMKPYRITGIPRFILIDKEGRIIMDNAPRPSSGEIRSLLNATLNK